MAKVFNIRPELTKERVRNDLRNDKHRSMVPSDVIDRMHTQFVRFCRKSVLSKEGFNIIEKL